MSKLSLAKLEFGKRKIIFTSLVSLFSLAVVFVGTYYVVKMRQTPSKSSAGSGVSLYFEPQNPTLDLNSDFSLNVKVNPALEKVTGVELYLNFDKDMIQINSIDSVPAFSAGVSPKTFLKDPVIDNSQGTASVTIGVLPEAPVGSVSDVVIVKGKTKNIPGNTLIIISQVSKAAAIDKISNVITNYGEASLNITFPPVNGGWTDWGVCSETLCERTGTQNRTCTNPLPQNGGADCSLLDGGNSSRVCYTAACPPVPTASCSVSPNPLPYGGNPGITLHSTNADYCYLFNDWFDINPGHLTSGTFYPGAQTVPGNHEGEVTCSNSGTESSGWNTCNYTVNNAPTPTPTPHCVDNSSSLPGTCVANCEAVGGVWTGTCSNGSQCCVCPPAPTLTPTPTATPTPLPSPSGQATATPTASPTGSPEAKVGDVNGDNQVNIVDIGIIIDNYGDNPANSKADINGDGKANIVDIGIIIDNYNK
jgi:hypothetical protein